MTNKKKYMTAVADINRKIDRIKQNGLLQRTTDEIRETQISLFDVAPWDDNMRAMPNDYARSALFTVRNKRQKRSALENKLIFHVNKDVSIFYTGIELRAEDDELVWQQILQYAKHFSFGSKIQFSMYELCQDLNWSINSTYYKKAEECLTRLQATAVQITSPRFGQLQSISLIKEFEIINRSTRKAKCQIEISEKVTLLFADNHYSRFIWNKYRDITPTARRLFDYLASHKEPFPLRLNTFRLMCGSESERPAKWKEQVKQACKELVDSDLVELTWVEGDYVYFKRKIYKNDNFK